MRPFIFKITGFKATVLLVTVAVLALSMSVRSETPTDGAQFTTDGRLVRPNEYREWPLIGTGFNMAYGPLREAANGHPMFTNVFVNPSSYRAFLKSGAWPDKTLFILEIRGATAVNKSSTGNNGHFQGEIMGIEAEVKDEARFPGKWGFFGLSQQEPSGKQIPTGASCYTCHAKNAAVENTFVQFYPVLRDVAKEQGTFKTVAEVF